MKVTLLVALLPLYIWMCTCETKQTKQTDDLKAYEKEVLWNKMRNSLQYIQASDHPLFMMKCGGDHKCDANDVSSIRWLGGTSEIAKNRFWQIYSCFKANDIKACPVDGNWGVWSPWSKCTAGCGEEANITRSRLCDNPLPVNEGLPCSGYNTKSSICRGKCNLSYNQSQTLAESEAFLTKIHRAYPRLRSLCLLNHCLYDNIVDILPPGDIGRYWSHLHCVKYQRACPVNGGWTSWTQWSTCDLKCGSGLQSRVRNCTNPYPANDGLICRGPFFEEVPCVGRKCELIDFLQDIYHSEWTVFGPCSVSCGQYGVNRKRKVCLSLGQCGKLLESNGNEIVITKPCFRGPCPVGGTWSNWSQYTNCSADCGKGRKIRIRTCDGLHSSDSTVCTGQSLNVTSCENRCKKDHTLTNGKAAVTASPFVPVHKVQPKVWKPDLNNPYLYELEPDRLDEFTQWSAWSQCSKSCEIGQKSRSRNCTVAGRCFGEVRQTLFCNIDKCPVNGNWSEWLAWSHCSATCGNGIKWRYRKCDKPLPKFGGTCLGNSAKETKCNLGKCKGFQIFLGHWTRWSSCSKQCGGGERDRHRLCKWYYRLVLHRELKAHPGKALACDIGLHKMRGSCRQMPCQVAGDWAHWGSWSACSHSCGGGFHFRDRTCTDPAPLYGGKPCKGHGSEVTPCFHGPCPDREDTGVKMNGSSGLLYSPSHKPQSYLSIYLLLHPLSPHGTIVYRSQACTVEHCRNVVNVSLKDGKPQVAVINRASKLIIKSNTTLQVREWHTIHVYLSQYRGFLRINNGAHLHGEYRPTPIGKVNYDSELTLGAKTDDGFVGVIAEANVNFQVLSLQRLSGWNGNGMPEDEWLTENVHVDPVSKYPKFKSDTFLKLFISDIKTLTIQMTIWPQKLEGLLLFNKGRIPGSFVYLIIHKGVFRYCFNCGQLSVCENIQGVEAMRWYHVSIIVSGTMSSIRINLGKAVQITSTALPYHTGSYVFVGGGESHDWVYLTEITGTDRGFSGVFHVITINDQQYTLRSQPLEDNRGFISTESVRSTEKIMEILERSDSKVVLRCDFSHYAHSESDVYVEWFNVDKKIKSSPDKKITTRLPGDSYIGALTLSAKHYGSGLYVCMVRHNGRLTNHKAFVLTRNNNANFEYNTARTEMTVVYTFLIGMAVFVLLALILSAVKLCKPAKEDEIARSPKKDKVETEFQQLPGLDDLYKWPSTSSLQSIPNHPSKHNTFGAKLDQPSAMNDGPRRSSVNLRDSQNTREDIGDEAIRRRSSVNFRGTQNTGEDINDETIPSDVQPPPPQISWTHRSTQQITKESARSGASQSPSRQLSLTLENKLSSSLPPAGSPSPPKLSLVRTSPLHQQPDLDITVSLNRSLTGAMDPQYTLLTLPSTEKSPPTPSQDNMAEDDVITTSSEETSSDGTSNSSDQSSDIDH